MGYFLLGMFFSMNYSLLYLLYNFYHIFSLSHRSVGGIRASLYNALSLEEANLLVSFMQEFYIQHKTVTSCQS